MAGSRVSRIPWPTIASALSLLAARARLPMIGPASVPEVTRDSRLDTLEDRISLAVRVVLIVAGPIGARPRTLYQLH